MRPYGIVLAAGDATRLPNKALLPIAGGQCVIDSSLSLLHAVNCERVIVVVKSGSLVADYLTMLSLFKRTQLQFVEQHKPGVLGAILSGVSGVDCDERPTIVCACDNVHDVDDYAVLNAQLLTMETHPCKREVIVREICGPELDGHYGGRWRSRSECPEMTWRFAGWQLAQAGVFRRFANHTGLIDALNALEFSPYHIMHPTRWHDVGTPDGYARYLRSIR